MHDEHSKTSDPAVGSTRLVGRVWRDPGSQKCRCGHVRNRHETHRMSDNTACRHPHCECKAFTPNTELRHGAKTPKHEH